MFCWINAFCQCGSCPETIAPNAGKDWLGTVDSDWENAANWSGGTLPTTNRIEINPDNYTGNAVSPVISSPSSFIPNDIVITNGGVLTVSNTLTISDDFIISGDGSTLNITSGSNASGDDTNVCKGGTLNISGGSFDNTSGSGILRICTLNPTAATNDPEVNITGGSLDTNDTSAGDGDTDASTGDEPNFINISGGGSFVDPTDPSLPVELINFEASVEGATVALEWSTATEIDNSHFEVERSVDGAAFDIIGVVGGNGTTDFEQTYEFIDFRPARISYYRLKQVDYDGQYEYHPIIRVALNESPGYKLKRPTVSNDFMEYTSDFKTNLVLHNSLGQVVREFTTGSSVMIPVSDLKAGIYFISIQQEGVLPVVEKIHIR